MHDYNRASLNEPKGTTLDEYFHYCKEDSICVFNDPFFNHKTSQCVSWGQIVYAYKYDESKQAVLISDCPTLNCPERKILGWIPSDMIAEVGQNRVCLLKSETINGHPLQSSLLFFLDGNNESKDNRINLPMSIWDTESSRIINIKGGSFPLSEISRFYNGSKHLNIHLLFFEKDKSEVKALASTLQSMGLKIPVAFHTAYSLTAISDNGNRHLKCTSDYAQWLASLEKLTSNHVGVVNSAAGFQAAINTIFKETPYVKFENNALSFWVWMNFLQLQKPLKKDWQNGHPAYFLCRCIIRIIQPIRILYFNPKNCLMVILPVTWALSLNILQTPSWTNQVCLRI